jgi:hypothetical protein
LPRSSARACAATIDTREPPLSDEEFAKLLEDRARETGWHEIALEPAVYCVRVAYANRVWPQEAREDSLTSPNKWGCTEKMAEVLCVYRKVKLLKKAAAAQDGVPKAPDLVISTPAATTRSTTYARAMALIAHTAPNIQPRSPTPRPKGLANRTCRRVSGTDSGFRRRPCADRSW